jgi:large subunit ribosomal protein L7/L12
MADEEVKNEETVEETPAAETPAETPAEEPKAEEKPAEEPKKEEKAEPTGKFADLIKQIETMSVLELSELVKALEDRFGVSAAAPVMMAGAGAPAAGAAPAEEEKSAYNLVLTSAGGNKIAVIKAVREILPDLGLKEAKDLVDGAPGTVKENMKKEDAEAAKEKLVAAGASVELQ